MEGIRSSSGGLKDAKDAKNAKNAKDANPRELASLPVLRRLALFTLHFALLLPCLPPKLGHSR
jgi:hypothetical protein